LLDAIIDYADELRRALEAANGDVDLWCANMGVELRRMKLKHDAMALSIRTLFGHQIILRKGLSKKAQVASVAHELCHERFHADCVAYRDLRDAMIERNERQADLFAGLVLFPTLTEYETQEAFVRTCGVKPEIAQARIEFFERYGW
jgi:Zn-dependent peptidase ImmA (M78 family)